MTSNIPRLCGGTFFTLLLQAVKPHNRSHVTINGGRVKLSNANVFRALIRVYDPTSYLPDDKSFNTMTSKYKNCNKIGDAYFRYEDAAIISAFEKDVLTNYPVPLYRMKEFVETYIDIDTPAKGTWLVRALLELIMEDSTISKATPFYTGENGSALTKEQYNAITDIPIESFLLGVWHFIIMNRNDNTVGKETIESWHALPNEPNAQRAFTSKIGEHYRSDLNISRITDVSSFEENVDEPEVEVIEPEIIEQEQDSDENSRGADSVSTNQTVNVFNQFGNGNTQIGSVGTFINK
ncbi:TPA: hypothetical protein ACGPAZ_000211 [Streptococcus suis]